MGVNGANPTSLEMHIYISCEEEHSLPPHAKSGQRTRLSGTASHPHSSSTAKGGATGNTKFFLKSYLYHHHFQDRVQTNAVFLEPFTVLLLANLSHYVWFATYMSA